MTTELIVSHDLKLQTNMEELETRILADIKDKYDVTVTDETVAESKKLMASVNKEKDDFKKRYKSFKDLVTEPFKVLDAKAKAIEAHYDEARNKIASQVQVFEQKKLDLAKEVCTKYRDDVCTEKGIDSKAVVIEDICQMLTAVTGTGKLSSSAQEKIDSRIAVIENEILKEKMKSIELEQKNREIAERARLEAEADKLRAVAIATLEAETRVRSEQQVQQPVVQPINAVEPVLDQVQTTIAFDFGEATTSKMKLRVEFEYNNKDNFKFDEICLALESYFETNKRIGSLSIINLETGEVS